VEVVASPVRHRPSYAADILFSYRHGGRLFEVANDNRRRRPRAVANKSEQGRLYAVVRALVGLIGFPLRTCRRLNL
jgi:hypothetical protein